MIGGLGMETMNKEDCRLYLIIFLLVINVQSKSYSNWIITWGKMWGVLNSDISVLKISPHFSFLKIIWKYRVDMKNLWN